MDQFTEAVDALQRARLAFKEERYDDALREHLWLYHQGPEELRLSYSLFCWTRLTAVHPPARAALDEVRGRIAARLLDGSGDHADFNAYDGINRHLDDDHLTSALYVELHQRHPALAAHCIRRALPALVKNGEFQLARGYFGSPARFVATEAAYLNGVPRRTSEKVHQVELRAMAEISNYCMTVNLLLETLRAVGEPGDEIKQAALTLPQSEDLRRDVRRELASPGILQQELVAAQMTRDGQDGQDGSEATQ